MTAPQQSCGRCGRPLAHGAFTCSGCGAAAPRLTAETRIAPHPAWNAPQPAGPAPSFGEQLGWAPGPPPPPRRSFAAVAVVLAVLLTGGGVWWWVSTHAPQQSAAAAPSSTAPSAVQQAGTRPVTALAPGDQLETQVQRDRADVEAVVGAWVPQVGSKQVGTVDRGTVYDEAAIWADVVAAKARYPETRLLRSDDYSSFKRGGFWVLVVATPFRSAADANAWCAAQGLGRDDCFAKRLSHSEGPQGNTVPR